MPTLGTQKNNYADTVYRSGRIYTVNREQPWGQAVAVQNDKFVAVGSNYDVEIWTGPETQVVDLEGQFVMPGVYDMHCHPNLALVPGLRGEFYLPENATPEEIKQLILDYANKNPGDGWIVAHGWDTPSFEEAGITPDWIWLDSFMADRPVFIVDRTTVYNIFNRKAAEIAGVDENTPNPRHGYFERDPVTGDLTGLVIDGAQAIFWDAMPPVPQEVYLQAYERAVKMLAANGVMGAKFSQMSVEMIEAVHRLDEDDKLPLRCETHLSWKDDYIFVKGRWDHIAGKRFHYRSERVNANCIKFHFDGVVQGRTSYYLTPYRDGTTGHINSTPIEIKDLLVYMDKIGIRVDAHCVGDAAARIFLDGIEEARKKNGPNGPRHQVTHTCWIHFDDRGRFKELNVIPEFSPIYWFPSMQLNGLFTSLLTEEHERTLYPIAEILEQGGKGVIGTDWPVTPLRYLWLGLECLITRRDPFGETPGITGTPITLEQALEMLTINGAWSMEIEDKAGNIMVGKSADFIVLDRNLFEIPANEIHKVEVKGSVFMGKPVFVDEKDRKALFEDGGY